MCSDRTEALESVDNILHQIFITSEKNCRKIRTDLESHSPELSALVIKRKFWRNVVYYKQHIFKDHTYLFKTSHYLDIASFHMTLGEAINNLK